MTSDRLSKELNFAKSTARRAGEIALDYYGRDFAVHTKDDKSPVTDADKAVDNFITAELAKHFPEDAVLSEESVPAKGRHLKSRLWCVDPIDGTKEFIARNGEFVVMIGLALQGESVLGVVYQPTADLLVWGHHGVAQAQRGKEKWLLRVSSIHSFEESTILVSRNRNIEDIRNEGQRLGVDRFKPKGSLGLKIAEIAGGNGEIYLTCSTLAKEWDTCAPEAILRAAGGCLTDVTGCPMRYNKADVGTPMGVLATNGVMHQACLGAIGKYPGEARLEAKA